MREEERRDAEEKSDRLHRVRCLFEEEGDQNDSEMWALRFTILIQSSNTKWNWEAQKRGRHRRGGGTECRRRHRGDERAGDNVIFVPTYSTSRYQVGRYQGGTKYFVPNLRPG